MLDKFSFTLGVIVICLSEWLILRLPNLFPYFYYAIMAVLMAYRYYDYASQKAELFMLDFCYFVNLSVMLQTAFYPDNLMWFKANYVLCMGPICIAIMVWKNSLVFHSLDKLTSFFLHAFPTMTCHLFRWRIVDHSMKFTDASYMGWQAHLVYPFGMYVAWQIGYLFMTGCTYFTCNIIQSIVNASFTEVVLKSRLDADQDLITSIRYLTRDKKYSLNKILKKFCQKHGYLGPNEDFDSESVLAKTVFVVSQVIYTVVTILHPPILFTSYYLSCVFLICVFTMAVWNGASYYIEVFSKRYNLKFEEKTESRKESTASVSELENEEFHDDFAEALEDIDLDELLAMADDETTSNASSKGMS